MSDMWDTCFCFALVILRKFYMRRKNNKIGSI